MSVPTRPTSTAASSRCLPLRQYQLQLRPDEVLAQGDWPAGATPRLEEIQAALSQLAAWGNLEAQPDMARVSSLNDYYRARYLYRLSAGGEAVEAALTVFAQSLERLRGGAGTGLAAVATDCGRS